MFWRSLLFWLGFIPVVPLALYVRKTATRTPSAPGPRQGKQRSPEPASQSNAEPKADASSLSLLAVGDSIIDGTGCSSLAHAVVGQTALQVALQCRCDVSWHAIAQSGMKAAEVQALVQREKPQQAADLILVSVGVNDVTGLRRLASWRRDLAALLSTLQQHSPQALIAVIGLPPMGEFPLLPQPLRALFGLRAKSFELVAQRFIANLDKVIYMSVPMVSSAEQFADDGYHPGNLGCKALGAEFASIIAANIER